MKKSKSLPRRDILIRFDDASSQPSNIKPPSMLASTEEQHDQSFSVPFLSFARQIFQKKPRTPAKRPTSNRENRLGQQFADSSPNEERRFYLYECVERKSAHRDFRNAPFDTVARARRRRYIRSRTCARIFN